MKYNAFQASLSYVRLHRAIIEMIIFTMDPRWSTTVVANLFFSFVYIWKLSVSSVFFLYLLRIKYWRGYRLSLKINLYFISYAISINGFLSIRMLFQYI